MALSTIVAAAVLGGVGLTMPAVGVSATGVDPVAAALWSKRVLLAGAPSADDPSLHAQREAFRAMGEDATERDLVLVTAIGTTREAEDLRRRFGLDPGRFAVVLIGKDGGVKLRSAAVLGPDRLVATIDAMPMRQEEMRRQGTMGSGRPGHVHPTP